MPRTLNLGILAHVDAGKTSLTERLLHTAGVIDEIGSVDAGSTQTDSLELERRRGITIKSAVVAFPLDGLTVNLIDTPGHPDFIAEVERVLGVLDGAVLVISAVEGVQAQTRVLMRTLRRLGIPTLLFVNKIDRRGAREQALLDEIAERLTPAAVPLHTVRDLGTPRAGIAPASGGPALDVLTLHDDELLAAYVAGTPVPQRLMRRALREQTAKAQVYPVCFGSAITGAGVDALTVAIRDLLPAAAGDPDAPLSGTVFKVERGPAGEKIAYARLFTGTLGVRDRLPGAGKVTAIGVFEHGTAMPAQRVAAGQIGKLWGLAGVRVGDPLGAPPAHRPPYRFAPPTLEAVVVARGTNAGTDLHTALSQLAEQDPLINLRQDDTVSLYGEVQKEVIQATLAAQYGLDVTFRESTTICVERPAGTGAAVEFIGVPPNPFLATVGLRVEPAPPGGGVTFRLGVELGSMPPAFFRAVEETVRATLTQGLSGWEVLDCAVTMTHAGYWARQSHAHGTFDKSMSSTAGDFRGLTPLVLMAALREAGTTVLEPLHRFRLELPADLVGIVLPALTASGAVPLETAPAGRSAVVTGTVAAALVHGLRRQLPRLTRGEGVLESAFERYKPVRGAAPSRPRRVSR